MPATDRSQRFCGVRPPVLLHYYLVGVFLQKHGDPEKSQTYLMRSATSPHFREYMHILAVSALRARKISIGPMRDDEIAKP